MIKRFVILRRKSGMSVEEFRDYWQHVHGPLIARIPGLMKYIQYHVHSEISDNIDSPIDGVAYFSNGMRTDVRSLCRSR